MRDNSSTKHSMLSSYADRFRTVAILSAAAASAWALLATLGRKHNGNSLLDQTTKTPAGYAVPVASLTLGLVVYLAVELLKFRNRRRELHRAFEQMNVPHLGNAKLLGGHFSQVFGQRRSALTVHELHAQLGPTFGLFYGAEPWIQTSDLELLQRVFVDRPALIDQTQFRMPFVTEFNESLAQVNGDKWRRTRRIIAPSFASRQMQTDNVFNDIDQVGDQFVALLEAQQRGQAGGEARLEVHQATKQYTLEVFFRLAFGRVHRDQFSATHRDELIDWIDESARLCNGFMAQASVMFAPLRHLLGWLVPFTVLGACIGRVHAIVDESLEARQRVLEAAQSGRQPRPAGVERKMIDSLMASKIQGKMDNATFKANLFFLLMAGHETTSVALTCLLFNLAWAQDKQERLREALGEHGARAQYLDWCICETMRLHPPAPGGPGRILERDLEHKGMRLSKGTSVNASIWTIHRTPDYWGADVDQFRPERMADPVDERERPYLKLRDFSFGHGPRYCLGKSLAMAEMRDVITKVILRYRVEPSCATPRQLECSSPNIIHWIIEQPVELKFTRISAL